MTRLSERMRRRAGAMAVDGFFGGLSRLGRLHPRANPRRHGVERIEDVPYRDTGLPEHLLDIYRPKDVSGPLPVVLHIHGGGFRILSKDSHWLMGIAFAKQGYLVFNINYRLAPAHRYPAALEDASAALSWVIDNAERYGGDLSRLVYAGESAGANLATTLAVAGAYERDESIAKGVWRLGVQPSAVVAFCGILQVSEPERFWRDGSIPIWIRDRLEEVSSAYLGSLTSGPVPLADPLLILESSEPPARALPPFFAPVGTADPILDDTRRLKVALEALDVPCRATYYEGEPHAFHALIFRRNAVQCWADTFAFLDEVV